MMGRKVRREEEDGLWRDEEWLRARYEDELLGVPTVAKLAGCSRPTIVTWLQEFGIHRRNMAEASRARIAQCLRQQREEFEGKRFGRLVVVRYAGYRRRGNDDRYYRREGRNRYHYWLCECDCGGTTLVADHNLRKGNVQSCGCLAKELGPGNRLPQGEAAHNYLFAGYRCGARDRDLKWALTREQVRGLVTQNCYYCGASPSQTMARFKGFVYNGIDRKDNGKGYVSGNVVACCWECNNSKGTKSVEEFLALVERIHNYQQRRQDGA